MKIHVFVYKYAATGKLQNIDKTLLGLDKPPLSKNYVNFFYSLQNMSCAV
jgi:hypothetical protein